MPYELSSYCILVRSVRVINSPFPAWCPLQREKETFTPLQEVVLSALAKVSKHV